MSQPREQIGRIATETLLDILERGRSVAPVRVVLSSDLVVRESTAPLRVKARAVG
jgi:DNA-binding LacI/PurR family transcriptional regulator